MRCVAYLFACLTPVSGNENKYKGMVGIDKIGQSHIIEGFE